MKEIIYIQAGNYSNYIGTHFWNAQESYFTYGNDEKPIVNHDISFREGQSTQNAPTFCPRVLIFDHKRNFGTLGRYNELYSGVCEEDSNSAGALWAGAVSEHTLGQIAKSEYLQRIDNGEFNGIEGEAEYRPLEPRFWSDYNRMFFIPRSIHPVSELPEWETSKGDWNNDKASFEKYNAEKTLNEEALRQFAEECDNMQGFQLSFDNVSFGGFCNALLESLRDEFQKMPVLTFPLLSEVLPAQLDFDDAASIKAALRDAICLQSLNELATQIVPIQHPSVWQPGDWARQIDMQKTNPYHTSALLSAHIESATLPLRLKEKNQDLSSMCLQLNWLSTTRFSQLRGMAPFFNKKDDPRYYNLIHDYSSVPSFASHVVAPEDLWKGTVANFGVTRGVTPAQLLDAEDLLSCPHLTDPYFTTINAPAYNLPSSYPRIFCPHHLGTLTGSSYSTGTRIPTSTTATTMKTIPQAQTQLFSSLTTNTALTTRAFRAYATLVVGECLRRRVSAQDAAGLDMDALKELREELWSVADAYDEVGARIAGISEDEEGLDVMDVVLE